MQKKIIGTQIKEAIDPLTACCVYEVTFTEEESLYSAKTSGSYKPTQLMPDFIKNAPDIYSFYQVKTFDAIDPFKNVLGVLCVLPNSSSYTNMSITRLDTGVSYPLTYETFPDRGLFAQVTQDKPLVTATDIGKVIRFKICMTKTHENIVSEYTSYAMSYALQCANSVFIHNGLNLPTKNLYTPAVSTDDVQFNYYDYPFNLNDVIQYSNDNGVVTISTKDGSPLLDAYHNKVVAQGSLHTTEGKDNVYQAVITFTEPTKANSALTITNLPSSNSIQMTINDYNPAYTYVVAYAWGFIS